MVRAAKDLHFNKNMEALKKMQAGADKLATVVGVTLGPKVCQLRVGKGHAWHRRDIQQQLATLRTESPLSSSWWLLALALLLPTAAVACTRTAKQHCTMGSTNGRLRTV